MITLPKYLRVAGHVVRIKRVPGLIKDQEAFGVWHDDLLEIHIDASLVGSLAFEVLIHEMMECVSGMCDFRLGHEVIQTTSLLLSQMLQSMFETGQQDG